MKLVTTDLPGVVLVEPRVFADARGHFLETHQAARYGAEGGFPTFVQDNLARSRRHVLRGLHYQLHHPQGKLVWVAQGAVYDVVVDIRRGSPTFGRWAGVTLDAEAGRQIYVPPGYAHGYCVTSDGAVVCYKCTDYYLPEDEYGLAWDDPGLAIDWPVADPVLSDKDRALGPLADLDPARLPAWTGDP